MRDRFVLLKRERDLTDQELLMKGWTLNYPLLGDAYRLKEAFYDAPLELRTTDRRRRNMTHFNREIRIPEF